ncbi:MAG: RusA family crossover junction endodeoxyribonuclease [Bacilli bacterium]
MQKIIIDKLYSYQTVVKSRRGGYSKYRTNDYHKYEHEITNQLDKSLKINDCEPIVVKIDFFLKIPASYSQKKKNALNGKYCTKKKDLDNLAKLVNDIIFNYYGWKDEFIVDLHLRKFWDIEKEWFEITIENKKN